MTIDKELLINLTADIAAAHVSNNSVATGDVGTMIERVFATLQGLNSNAPSEPEKPKGAVTIRASIKPDHLISMIDGKPYKMLKRHITLQGYTPQSYREAFSLPADYPMVAASYAKSRRDLALKIGLGKKPPVEPVKPARKPRAAKPKAPAAKAPSTDNPES